MSWKTLRARRTAEIEHDFIQDKDAWSASVEGVKWTGVSMFRLASPVEPRVMRSGQRSSDRDWLHQARRTVAVVTGSHRTSQTESVKLALGQIHVSAVLGLGRKKGPSRESSSRHGGRPESKGDLEYAESVRSHHGSRTKPIGDDHRVHKSSTRLKPADTAVRPTLYA